MNTSVKQLLGVLTTRLSDSGKWRTASAYSSAVHCAQRVMNDDDGSLQELFTPTGIRLCEQRLYSRGLCGNTISFYMRMLRAIYNKGVGLGLCPAQPHLFDGVYTGIDTTPKRAVDPSIFGRLQALELSGKAGLAFARDLFLLSFSLQGISFVDLVHLRKSDLKNGLLTYRRAKTGSAIVVALPTLAGEIIGRYTSQTADSPYLLPIIKNPDGDVGLQHRSALRTYNRRLQKLAGLAGISEHLTSYVTRHTWATTAQQVNAPTGLISQALGHRAEEMTRIYLAGFDYSVLYQTNEKIMHAANLVSTCAPVENKGNDNVVDGETKNVSHLKSERHFRRQT